jgi:hypothetical protein
MKEAPRFVPFSTADGSRAAAENNWKSRDDRTICSPKKNARKTTGSLTFLCRHRNNILVSFME